MPVNNHADSRQQLQDSITESLHHVGRQAKVWLPADEPRALDAALDCDMAGVAWHLGLLRANELGLRDVTANYTAQAYNRINHAIRNMAEQNAPAQLQADAETLRQRLAAYRQPGEPPAAAGQSQTPATTTSETGFPDLQTLIREFAISHLDRPIVRHMRDALNAIVAWQTLVRADAPTAAVRPAYQAACSAVELAGTTYAPADMAAAKVCKDRIWETAHAYYRGR